MVKEYEETTEELSKLRAGVPHTWGRFIKIHDVSSEFSIVEYIHADEDIHEDEYNVSSYSSYVYGEHTGTDWDSFDKALLSCIVYKGMYTEYHRTQYTTELIIKMLDM